KEVKAKRAQGLETVVVVVQSQRRSGARARPLHFGQELLQAARLQPSVVIQEKEELAARRSRRAIIALAVTQILAVLHEDASRPSLDDSFPQLVRAVAGSIVRENDFDPVEDCLGAQRIQAALQP